MIAHVLTIFDYRSCSGWVWDVLAALIGSGSPSPNLLALGDSFNLVIFVFAGAAFVALVCPVGFVKNACIHRQPTSFHAWTHEMDPDFHQCQGALMIVDSSEQGDDMHGLAFPHVLGEDGQHSVQHIDM